MEEPRAEMRWIEESEWFRCDKKYNQKIYMASVVMAARANYGYFS
jgi:hypothetical protein